MAHLTALNTVLSVQWADAVPGTPGWHLLLAVAQLLATLAAGWVVTRAAGRQPA